MFTFSALCSSKYFVIPANQRGYSWGVREVEDMLNDLVLADTNAHYLGPVIVTQNNSIPLSKMTIWCRRWSTPLKTASSALPPSLSSPMNL